MTLTFSVGQPDSLRLKYSSNLPVLKSHLPSYQNFSELDRLFTIYFRKGPGITITKSPETLELPTFYGWVSQEV
jgi:hypothetical protein